MPTEDPIPQYPRSKDELLRDFDVAGKLRDIRDTVKLRERLTPKWWEAAFGLVQFAAALGLLAAILQHTEIRGDAFNRLIVFWGTLMVLSLVLGFEFMIFRLHHLRRACEISLRRIDTLERELEELRKPEAPPPPDAL